MKPSGLSCKTKRPAVDAAGRFVLPFIYSPIRNQYPGAIGNHCSGSKSRTAPGWVHSAANLDHEVLPGETLPDQTALKLTDPADVVDQSELDNTDPASDSELGSDVIDSDLSMG